MKKISIVLISVFCIIVNSSNAQIIKITSTNGTIASFNPTPTTPPFTPSTSGPYISDVNKNGKIVNICSGNTITLNALPSSSTGFLNSYQWYVCSATQSTIFRGFSDYTWSTWKAISGGTARTLNVTYSSIPKTTLHLIYICVISNKGGTSYTGAVALSKATTPVIQPLNVETHYVCPGQQAKVVPDFEVSGDNVSIYWQQQNRSTGVWTNLTSTVSPFYFDVATYRNGTYDYRLAVDHSCINYRSEALAADLGVTVDNAVNEAYTYIAPANRIKTVCLNSQTDFTASLSQSNGFHVYSYSWDYSMDGGATWTTITSTANGLFADYTTLSLKVRPSSSTHNNMLLRCKTIGACQTIVSDSFTLKVQMQPDIIGIQTSQNTVCEGTSITLTAELQPNILADPVQYRWRVNGNIPNGHSFSTTNSSFTYIMQNSPVEFICEVQNSGMCINQVDTYSKTINVYSNPTTAINVTTNGCGNVSADLTAQTFGGKTPYTYVWTIPPTGTSTNQIITNQPTNQTYSVVVTDACGKTDTESVAVSSLPLLSFQKTITDVLCNGQQNGEIHLNIAGGVMPYNIILYKEDENAILQQIDSIKNVTDGLQEFLLLEAGKYSIKVTDLCGVIVQQNATVSQPNPLIASITDFTNVTCYKGGDGTATVSAWGGVMPYTINWINGQHSSVARGLFAGDYIVNIIDNNGCLYGTSIEIAEPQVFEPEVSFQNISCFGLQDATIDISMTGGTQPYTSYVVSNNDTLIGTSFDSLQAGVYQVFVSDSCGAMFQDMITITEPLSLSIQLPFQNISCVGRADGEIQVEVDNQVGDVSYLWSNTDTVANISNVSSGMYTVTVTDQCGSVTDSVQIYEPDTLLVSIDKTDISCYGGIDSRAIAFVEGGTEPYYYSWSNGKIAPFIENVAAGRYSVSVTDKNNCIAQQSISIEVPSKLSASSLVTNVSCNNANDGEIILIPQNGSVPYLIQWNNSFDGDTIENVAAGNYSVTIYDNCNDSVTIIIPVTQPQALKYEELVSHITCNGANDGIAEVLVSKGVEPYSILWNTGLSIFKIQNSAADTLIYTLADQCVSIVDTIIIEEPHVLDVQIQTTEVSCYGLGDATATAIAVGGVAPYTYRWNTGSINQTSIGLFPGLYSVNVFDARGCLASEVFTVNGQLPLEGSVITQNTPCNLNDGQIITHATGGVAPYSFYCVQLNMLNDTISNLGLGMYDIEIIDANGCITAINAEIGTFVPEYPICLVTVSNEGKNRIIWQKYFDEAITKVNIYKMVSGEYEWMGTIDSSRFSYFDDPITNPVRLPSRYVITSEDQCGNESDFSPFHQTIHLGSAIGTDGRTAVLDWTEYLDESHSFEPRMYYLFRGTEPDNLVLFDSVDVTIATEYNDDDRQGAIYYQVGVKPESPCVVTGMLKSESGPFTLAISNIAESEAAMNIIEIENTKIELSPNPNKGKCILKSEVLIGSTISVFDISGKLVWKKSINEEQTEIDISKNGIGIYSLVVLKNGKEFQTKFVVLK